MMSVGMWLLLFELEMRRLALLVQLQGSAQLGFMGLPISLMIDCLLLPLHGLGIIAGFGVGIGERGPQVWFFPLVYLTVVLGVLDCFDPTAEFCVGAR